MSLRSLLPAVFSIALCVSFLSGCHSAPTEQTPQSQSVDAIVKQSGGDWAKLSPSDHERLVKEIGNGNERTAQMNFSGRWSRLQGGRGAMPPRPGGPP